MCGIFAYAGESRDASQAVLEGLKRLDYRGYDSWGVAALSDGFIVSKHVGVVDPKKAALPKAAVAIGHTRWATHGAVTQTNAHPHAAADGSFMLAHNGIVENFSALKLRLEKRGHRFVTQTDTEAIVRLIEDVRRRETSLIMAVRDAFSRLEGRNTIIVLSRDGSIIAARNGSPLVVGRGASASEMYLSSDVLSFASHVREVAVLDNGTVIALDANGLRAWSGTSSSRLRFEKNAIVGQEVSKGRFAHFMIKEIHESPTTIEAVLAQQSAPMKRFASALKKARNVYCVGSGTAGAAAAQIAYYLRTIGGIRATALIGAESSDYYKLFGRGDILIAPSQSGETADVLEVLEIARAKGARIASHVNMPGSFMTRISDFPFMAQAGPEICVMSTKIFVSQIAWGYLLAHHVAGDVARGRTDLRKTGVAVRTMLQSHRWQKSVRALAREYAHKEHVFLLGKGQNVQIIKEAMVKIIEGAYIHAHGIPAGDLKHYAITLMQKGTPVLAVVSDDGLKKDVENAMHEVRARGAAVTAVSPTAVPGAAHLQVPDTRAASAITNIVALQVLAYEMAVVRGNNVDKPRNIAKSVTVR